MAAFPWDPKPEPPAAPPAAPAPAVLPTPAPSQPQYSQAQLTPQAPSGIALPNGPAAPVADVHIKAEPAIKQEPGLAPSMPAVPPAFGPGRANEAALRATQNLQASYGSRAANSINAITAGIGAQQRTQVPIPVIPGQPGTTAAQFRPGGQAQAGSVQTAQTDGAAEEDDDDAMDFEGVLMQRDEAGNLAEMGRVDIDRMLHDQIAAKARAMEGGGLMLPLKEATRRRGPAAKAARRATGADGTVSNMDGNLDDDEEVDEDAINSDLDDPDERSSDDEDDDETLQHVMLCMYDKVQRVKNKWYDFPWSIDFCCYLCSVPLLQVDHVARRWHRSFLRHDAPS